MRPRDGETADTSWRVGLAGRSGRLAMGDTHPGTVLGSRILIALRVAVAFGNVPKVNRR